MNSEGIFYIYIVKVSNNELPHRVVRIKGVNAYTTLRIIPSIALVFSENKLILLL